MKYLKSIDRIVDVFLVLLLILSFFSFPFLRTRFLFDSGPAFVFSSCLFVVFLGFLSQRIRLIKDLKIHQTDFSRPLIIISVFFLFLCFASIIIYTFVALRLRSQMIWADEWNLFHRVFFSEDLMDVIFTRYNHHPSYLINALIVVVAKLLSSNTLWFSFINVGSILIISYIYFQVIYRNFTLSLVRSERLVLASLMALYAFWILAGKNVFWNVPNFQVLGAVLSIYGLSIQGTEGIRKGAGIFLIGALMLSTSFGNGAVVWPLGFIASILLKQKNAHKLGYLIIGLIGPAMTMGVFSTKEGIIKFNEWSTMLQAIPVYLGAVSMKLINVWYKGSSHISIALCIGGVGLMLFSLLVFNQLKKKHLRIDPTFLFAVLLGLFTIGCGVLVLFGRLNDDLSIMIAGRYTCWSALFWISILFLLIVWFSELENFNVRRTAFVLLTLLGFSHLILNNIKMIESRLITYNIEVRSKLDIIVNPNGTGNETMTFRPEVKNTKIRNKVNLVNETLKNKHQNIYLNPVTHKMGERINDQDLTSESSMTANVFAGADKEGNYIEFYLEGGPQIGFNKPEAIVIAQDRIIIGMGFPYSDYYRGEMEKEAGMIPINNSTLLINHFPGSSNYYYAQFKPLSGSSNFELFSYTSEDKYERIKI
ncbi:MAG: hypothetical protein ACJA01_000566 [Saprospiraceae bacterium]|jgi:hypothetical protein